MRSATGPWTMLLGFALLGIAPGLVKALRPYGWLAADTVLFRFGFSCIAVLVTARLTGVRLRTQQPWLLLARGVLGGIAVLMFFGSVQLAGAGLGTLLNYTYPIWANLYDVALGARPSKGFWGLLTLAMLGVYLVVFPGSHVLGSGEALGLASAAVAGAGVLTIKRLRETDGELTIIASFSVVGGLFALPFACGGWLSEPERLHTALGSPSAWALGIGVGLLSFLGHVFFTRGYQNTSIQLGTMLSLSVPVVATIIGHFALAEPLPWNFMVGGVLILFACGLLGYRERKHTRCRQGKGP